MLINQYYSSIDNLFKKVRETQCENIIKAGKLIADTVEKGGAVHIFDTGHIINSELIERGGGLYLFKQLKYMLTVENPVRTRDTSQKNSSMEGLAKYVLRASNVLPGDVLIIGSVSGKTVNVVDLAIEAKKNNITVIAITSLSYSSNVESLHSSKKRLFECADIVIDNCAPAGEGLMNVEGLDAPLCAASGLAAAYIMWSMTTVIVEALIQKGITPSVYKSYNTPGTEEYNELQKSSYNEFGW